MSLEPIGKWWRMREAGGDLEEAETTRSATMRYTMPLLRLYGEPQFNGHSVILHPRPKGPSMTICIPIRRRH